MVCAWRLVPVLAAFAIASAPVAASADCGGIPTNGCCGQNLVKWCDDMGMVQTTDCKKQGLADNKVCGWWTDYGYYDCGGLGKDPSGALPYLCPGETCTPTCTGKACGSDGCSGTCGDCTGGLKCGPDFQCADLPDCKGVPYLGCCDGKDMNWCEKGYLHTFTCDKECGWQVDTSGNGGYDCGTTKGEDPSGQLPRDCSAYWGTADATPEAAEVAETADEATPIDSIAGDVAAAEEAIAAKDVVATDTVKDTSTTKSSGKKGCAAGPVGSSCWMAFAALAGLVRRRRG